MINVSAFHGSFASPKILQRDMGNPDWVDHYHRKWDLERTIDYCDAVNRRGDQVVLIGYSKGGSFIGDLTFHVDIAAAVLYESPLMHTDVPRADRVAAAPGGFPVLRIWNDRGRKDWPESRRTDEAWAINHKIDRMAGTGRHVSVDWSRWPPLGHAWDLTLNPEIRDWIFSNANQPTGQSRTA